MSMTFRAAGRGDVPDVLRLLRDDFLGQGREQEDMDLYLAAFDQMQSEGHNHLIVGEDDGGKIVATYQITFISGLSLMAAKRAQIESVRVDSACRGQGLGAQLVAHAELLAREAGCRLIQLTMNAQRSDTRRFYEREGFVASHTGFKKPLD